jgi:peptidoglycan/xylan/chitin deacetylase (PgdA/CDA1 family)
MNAATASGVWKMTARRVAASALYHSGAVRLVERATRNRARIITYHRILSAASEDVQFVQPGMFVTTERFEEQMRYLATNYQVVSLEEIPSARRPNVCAITFDDGWLDNYTNAYPVLQKYHLPATVFVATDYIGTHRWPWPDRLCFYLHGTAPSRVCSVLESALRAVNIAWNPGRLAHSPVAQVSEEIVELLKRLKHSLVATVMALIDDEFRDLQAELNRRRPWLSWSEIVEMSAHGISFGSHTKSHVILTNTSLAEARAEVVGSKEALSEGSGRPVTSFCYPNGAYSPELLRVVAEAGYRLAVGTRRGWADESGDVLALNRIMLHNDKTDTLPKFACVLANVVPGF